MELKEKYELKEQLLYVIANEKLEYQEYYLPYSYYRGSHIAAYVEFFSENPELNLGFTIDRRLPEQMSEMGMFVYQRYGFVEENSIEQTCGYDYSAGIFIPKNFMEIQKEKINSKLEELEEMHLELVYYEDNKKVTLCNNKREESEHMVYQKLKNIVRG